MPVFLKQIKHELESDIDKVGRLSNGDYKFEPPNIVGRKINKYPKLSITKFEKRPRFGTNAISFTALISSESEDGIRYKTTVQFHKIKFKDVQSAQFSNVSKMGLGKKAVIKYHRLPSVQKNPVTLKCACMDFRHRFETPLSKVGGLIGGPRKYTRLTQAWKADGTGGYPSVNSTKKLGICKHVSSLLNYLKDNKMIKER